jgi:hypothetical protein
MIHSAQKGTSYKIDNGDKSEVPADDEKITVLASRFAVTNSVLA